MPRGGGGGGGGGGGSRRRGKKGRVDEEKRQRKALKREEERAAFEGGKRLGEIDMDTINDFISDLKDTKVPDALKTEVLEGSKEAVLGIASTLKKEGFAEDCPRLMSLPGLLEEVNLTTPLWATWMKLLLGNVTSTYNLIFSPDLLTLSSFTTKLVLPRFLQTLLPPPVSAGGPPPKSKAWFEARAATEPLRSKVKEFLEDLALELTMLKSQYSVSSFPFGSCLRRLAEAFAHLKKLHAQRSLVRFIPEHVIKKLLPVLKGTSIMRDIEQNKMPRLDVSTFREILPRMAKVMDKTMAKELVGQIMDAGGLAGFTTAVKDVLSSFQDDGVLGEGDEDLKGKIMEMISGAIKAKTAGKAGEKINEETAQDLLSQMGLKDSIEDMKAQFADMKEELEGITGGQEEKKESEQEEEKKDQGDVEVQEEGEQHPEEDAEEKEEEDKPEEPLTVQDLQDHLKDWKPEGEEETSAQMFDRLLKQAEGQKS